MAQRNRLREATRRERRVQIAGRQFTLRRADVEDSVAALDPEPIASHYVVVGGRRYPPKQVVAAVTGLDRADFTTHHARRTLAGLGYPVGRRATARPDAAPPRPDDPEPARRIERLTEQLRPHVGEYVAIKDDELLYASPSPHEVARWVLAHGVEADTMYRVPEDEIAATGLAPL